MGMSQESPSAISSLKRNSSPDVVVKSYGDGQKGSIDPSPALAAVFGLSPIAHVTSETWTFNPDPMIFVGSGGQQLYKIDTLRFNLLTDGTKTVYTLSWNTTSLGWSTGNTDHPGPDVLVEIEDNLGGVVDHWDLGTQQYLCGGGGTKIYTQPNAQNVYGVAYRIQVTWGSYTWWQC